MINGLLNLTKTTLLQEISSILCGRHPISTELICDGIVLIAIDSVERMFNPLPILMVDLTHFSKFSSLGVVIGDELSCNLDWLCGVNLFAWTKEIFVPQPEGLHIATIFVTYALEPISAIIATICSFASLLPFCRTGVHGKS